MPKLRKYNKLSATLTQVAKLYYNDGMNHQEIAERLKVSRSLITQYLKKAKDQGIVRIEVIEPEDQFQELEDVIKSKAGLNHVKIISEAHSSDELTRNALASASVELLQELAEDNMILGLAWGRHVIDMVNSASEVTPCALRILPLFGESSAHNQYTQINHAVMTLATAFNCEANYLHSPMSVSTPAARSALVRDAEIKKVCSLWKSLDITIMGVGVLPPTPGMVPIISKDEIKSLVRKGAVGDICGHYYNEEGDFLASNLDDRIIGVTVKQLKKCSENIALTFGADKVRGVVGALRTGVLTGIVMDQACAEEVAEIFN